MSDEIRPCPDDVLDLIEYHPEWRTDHRFFIDEHNWSRFSPYFKYLKTVVGPGLHHSLLAHSTEPREGVRFGSTDRDLEKRVAAILNKATPQAQSKTAKPQSDREPGRPKGSKNVDYPFDDLKKVGDHFLMKTNGDYGQHVAMSIACKRKHNQDGRTYRTVTVDEGVLVLLVAGPDLKYNLVVRRA